MCIRDSGYLFKVLEMLGFSFGSMIPCAILRGVPYCTGCQRYLKKHAEAKLHSPVPTAEIKQLPRRDRAAAVQKAVDEVTARAVVLLRRVGALPLEHTLAAFREVSEEAVKKSTACVHVRLTKCPQCDAHHIATHLHFIAANGKAGHATLPPLDKTKSVSNQHAAEST